MKADSNKNKSKSRDKVSKEEKYEKPSVKKKIRIPNVPAAWGSYQP